MSRVAIVITSSNGDGALGRPTGVWLEEVASPYWTLRDAGHEPVLASVAGGEPPVDPASTTPESRTEDLVRFLADAGARNAFAATVTIADLDADLDAIFLAGGHGTMWDFPGCEELKALVERTAGGGIVAAVCHGAAGLLGVRTETGPLLEGRTITAFSDAEEQAVGAAAAVPFSLERRLAELGARYQAGTPFVPHAVRDANLISGQNPASSRATAALLVDALRDRRQQR